MRIDEAELEQKLLTILKDSDGGVAFEELCGTRNAEDVKSALQRLKDNNFVDSRKVGKSEFWYALDFTPPKKILIVEDDQHISKLIRLTIESSEREVREVADAESALKEIERSKPDLILLDLMLPGDINGLELCKKLKKDPQTKDIIIVIISAADAAVNRFYGIQFGADYYIKKPFNPLDLKALINIFLRRRGFDPLVDIQDIAKLIKKLKDNLNADLQFTKVEIRGLSEYQEEYSKKEARRIVRLVSQMLQDKINESGEEVDIAYLSENDFVIATKPQIAAKILDEVKADFQRVATFIKQKHKHKEGGDLFEKLERGKTGGQKFALSIEYYPINMEVFKQKFESQIHEFEGAKDLSAKDLNVAAIRNYTLEQIEQLRKLFESSKVDVDLKVEEVGGQIRITAGRKSNDKS